MKESVVRKLRLLLLRVFCVTGVNCIVVAASPSPLVWKLGKHGEVADLGTSVAFLWTATGGSSIAMDCLPGIVPQFKISRNIVFIDFPLWILFLLSIFALFILNHRYS